MKQGEVRSYEDLAHEKWKNKICTRSGKHPYMIALTASLIAHHGEQSAQIWLQKLRDNLARKPQGNDRNQVKAIKEGVCDVAVINHYYLYKMLIDPQQKSWVDAVYPIFPNQEKRGTHMNISGMALARYAPNKKNAKRLMSFLSGSEAQTIYAEKNGEYAINPDIPLAPQVAQWGNFKRDTISIDKIAKYRVLASKITDKVKYDH